jgi:hypothetical protein
VREFVRLRSCVRCGGILRKVKGKKKNGGFSAVRLVVFVVPFRFR